MRTTTLPSKRQKPDAIRNASSQPYLTVQLKQQHDRHQVMRLLPTRRDQQRQNQQQQEQRTRNSSTSQGRTQRQVRSSQARRLVTSVRGMSRSRRCPQWTIEQHATRRRTRHHPRRRSRTYGITIHHPFPETTQTWRGRTSTTCQPCLIRRRTNNLRRHHTTRQHINSFLLRPHINRRLRTTRGQRPIGLTGPANNRRCQSTIGG